MVSAAGQPSPFQPRVLPGKPSGVPAFGGKARGKDDNATDTVELQSQTFTTPSPADASQNAQDAVPPSSSPMGRNRFFGDKTRLAAGFVLEDVLPPLLGFAFVAGPVGWMVTLGSLPLSYAAGKLGRHIAGGVDKNNLPQGMKSFQDFREGFRNRDKLTGQFDLLNKWNVFIDDALNVRSGQYRALTGLVGGYLKASPTSKLGRILSSKQFLKANIYHDVAQSDSVGGAVKAGAKGGLSFWFFNVGLPGAGLAMDKAADMMWGPFKWPFKGMAWGMKNLPLLLLGKHVLFNQDAQKATH